MAKTPNKKQIKNIGVNDVSTGDLLPKMEFLARYKISKQDFDKTKLDWKELEAIFRDYNSSKSKLEHTASAIVNVLFSKEAKGVHSVRYRIKASNSVIEKIIKKKIKEPNREINISNYKNEITDLIGIRALHVFKNDWYSIHNFILEMFELKEGHLPIIYHREGDEKEFIEMCTNNGCKQEKHEKGYRSVHYIVATQLTKNKHFAEIQVRTIFEEGWSEIDHKIRYSYKSDKTTPFDSQLRALNGIAGNADEIGTSIKKLEEEEQRRILGVKKKAPVKKGNKNNPKGKK